MEIEVFNKGGERGNNCMTVTYTLENDHLSLIVFLPRNLCLKSSRSVLFYKYKSPKCGKSQYLPKNVDKRPKCVSKLLNFELLLDHFHKEIFLNIQRL